MVTTSVGAKSALPPTPGWNNIKSQCRSEAIFIGPLLAFHVGSWNRQNGEVLREQDRTSDERSVTVSMACSLLEVLILSWYILGFEGRGGWVGG